MWWPQEHWMLLQLQGQKNEKRNSCSSWVTDAVLGILCGVLLFLVLVRFWESSQSLPPPRKHRNSGKPPVEPKRRSRSRSRKKSGVLKACRECLQELEEARSLISLLGSHLGRPPEQGDFHQSSCQDSHDEVCKAVPARDHGPCGEPVEGAAPATSSSASQAPLMLCPLPLASALSAEHQDQSDLKGIPLGTIVKSSPPGNSMLASPNSVISDLGHSSSPISALSWWQKTARALYLSTSSQCESKQEHLPYHPPKASFQGDPLERQVKTGSLSFFNPAFLKLLEILLTKRVELKMWKEKDKEGSFSKQMNPEYQLNSFGNMWKSLGTEQDSTTLQPFCSMKDKQKQVPSLQQLSYLKLWGDPLQQKCSQLFWGLPSLHSESLVATAWVPKSSSDLQPLSVLFNGISNDSNLVPAPVQPEALSGLSQTPSMPLPGTQPQLLTGNLPQSQPPPLPQIQNQTNLISSLSVQPTSFPNQMRPSGVSCPTSQSKTIHFIPTEIKHLECSSLQKQQKSEKALPSVTKMSQNIFSQPTPNFPQNSGASHGQRSVPCFQRDFISPNLQKPHLQKRLMEDELQGGLHVKVQVSLELVCTQDQFPWVYQAQDNQGPLHLSAFAGNSCQDSEEMGFRYHRKSHREGQVKKDFTKGLQQCRIPKHLSRSAAIFAVKALGISTKKKSERYLQPSKSDSGTCLPGTTDKKQPEKLLNAHLSRKLEQIDQGLTPMNVGQPWLADNHAFPTCNTHMETRNLASLEGQEPYVNISCELSFLSPSTRQRLEVHIIKFQGGHLGDRPLHAFEATDLKLHKAQHSHLPQPPLPTSAVCVSRVHSKAKSTQVLGKCPQAFSEEVITKESFLTPAGVPRTTSPASEESHKATEGTPSGSGHGLSEAPLRGGENKLPSQSPTLSLKGKTQENRAAKGVEKKSLKPNPSSAVARNEPTQERGTQTSRDLCLRPAIQEMNLESEPSKAKGGPAWEVIVGPSVLASSESTNMDMRRSGSPGPSKMSLLPANSVAQGPEGPCLTTQMASKFELQGKVESGNQLQGHAPGLFLQDCYSDIFLQDCATGTLIQDDVTNVLLQDPHTDLLLAADILSSHRALCTSQREYTSGDLPAAQGPYDPMLSGWGCQGWQEPRISKVKDPGKSQRKMCALTDSREDNKRLKPGKHKEGLAELRTSQACGMSNLPQVRGIGDTLGRKYLQLLPERGQDFTECHFEKKMQILQGKGPAGPHQKGLPASTSAWRREPAKSRLFTDSGPIEAQEIMTAVGKILLEKLSLHQRLHAQECSQDKKVIPGPSR